MRTAEYTVRLDAFEGPLDLLLFLIRRAEVEISDIPISQITDQYLAYLGELAGNAESGSGIDIERAGEFLVMAATLMEIKSRMLAPPAAAGTGEGESEGAPASAESAIDPREELVRQLLEYKRFRDATERLDTFRREWEGRFPAAGVRPVPPSAEELAAKINEDNADGPFPGVALDDIELVDLVEAFARIIETVDLTRVGEHHVLMDETPVELHAEDIVDRLKRGGADGGAGELDFAEVFVGRNRSEMIGLFLALLELVRQRRVAVRQDEATARIVIALALEEPPTGDAVPTT